MFRWISMVVVTVVFLGFFVNEGNCIQCFLCSSLQTEDCVHPNINHLKLAKCDHTTLVQTQILAKNITKAYEPIFEVHLSDQRIDLDCLKMVIKVSPNSDVIIRGCQLAEQSHMDICHKVKQANSNHHKVKSCNRCSIDRCNGAAHNFVKFLVLIPLAFINVVGMKVVF